MAHLYLVLFMLTAFVTQRIVLHKRITPYDATTHYFQKTRISILSYTNGDTICFPMLKSQFALLSRK